MSDLMTVDGYSFTVEATSGTEPRARRLAERCDRAHRFLTRSLGMDAALRLLVEPQQLALLKCRGGRPRTVPLSWRTPP